MGLEMLADYRRDVRRERNARYLKKNRADISSKKMYLALNKYKKGHDQIKVLKRFFIWVGMSKATKNDIPRLRKNEAPVMHEMTPQVNLYQKRTLP